MHYPFAVTEMNQHCLDFWLWHPSFFSVAVSLQFFYCMPPCFVSGSYWKPNFHLQWWLCSVFFILLDPLQISTNSFPNCSWLLVTFLGTIFTQTFFIPKFSNSIICTVPLLLWITFLGCYTMWMWAMFLMFWRSMLPLSSRTKCVGLWVSVYVCFENDVGLGGGADGVRIAAPLKDMITSLQSNIDHRLNLWSSQPGYPQIYPAHYIRSQGNYFAGIAFKCCKYKD
jgi:hypothetical protein